MFPRGLVFCSSSLEELKVKQLVDELSSTVHLCRRRCHMDKAVCVGMHDVVGA